jgi:hypothetical protein
MRNLTCFAASYILVQNLLVDDGCFVYQQCNLKNLKKWKELLEKVTIITIQEIIWYDCMVSSLMENPLVT